ncbi:hypothetical protein PMI28_01955 [Pseudomonas sp. GM48]|nr:hypothetical protein PMI28_01955 [Pseudomonas sp. GM48]
MADRRSTPSKKQSISVDRVKTFDIARAPYTSKRPVESQSHSYRRESGNAGNRR